MFTRFGLSLASLAWLLLSIPPFPDNTSGQNAASVSASVPMVRLDVVSTTEVIGIDEPFFTESTCLPDNRAFLTRMVGPTGAGDIEVVSNDGKNIIRLNADKASDIPSPVLVGFTANESSIYLLVDGFTPQNKTLTLRRPDGKTETQPAYTQRTYIARFRRDGSYAGSVSLDLPFMPMQFGAFAQGDFFFTGAMKGTYEPRAALVKSTGQFDRFLELPGDIHGPSESGQPADDARSLPLKADKYQDTLQHALGFSLIVPDGADLLLMRPDQRSPVFSVSPGGSVRAVSVDVPEGFKLFDLKAARNEWIAIYTHPSKDPRLGLESVVYAVNKATGKRITQYIFPRNLGMALTCDDGKTLRVLTRENDKLQLVSLSPAP